MNPEFSMIYKFYFLTHQILSAQCGQPFSHWNICDGYWKLGFPPLQLWLLSLCEIPNTLLFVWLLAFWHIIILYGKEQKKKSYYNSEINDKWTLYQKLGAELIAMKTIFHGTSLGAFVPFGRWTDNKRIKSYEKKWQPSMDEK